jgi:hypothetical protein
MGTSRIVLLKKLKAPILIRAFAQMRPNYMSFMIRAKAIKVMILCVTQPPEIYPVAVLSIEIYSAAGT